MGIEGKHFYRFTYLKSEEWHSARIVALARAGAKCCICGEVDWGNDCHHRKYPENIWDTTPWHLIVLCRTCHAKLHSIYSTDASKGKWRRKRFRLRREHIVDYALKHPRPLSCLLCRTEEHVSVFFQPIGYPVGICDKCKELVDHFDNCDGLRKSKWRALVAIQTRLERFFVALQAFKWMHIERERSKLKRLRIAQRRLGMIRFLIPSLDFSRSLD